VYVAGWTLGTLPGQTRTGGTDAFVRKYDFAGTAVWTRQFGTSAEEQVWAISVDATGVYVAGATYGTLPGQTRAGGFDAFVRKYDSAGSAVWTRQFGTSAEDVGIAISVGARGVYVAGRTAGTFPGQTSAGWGDAFVRKYDSAGTAVWTRQFGTSADDSAQAISVDATGVYMAGTTTGTFPGQTSAGSLDVFVRKYDFAGTAVWTRQFGTSAGDYAEAISVDATGVYVAGGTYGTLPGQTSAGGFDAFVRKYDSAGTAVWTRQFGTSAGDGAEAISVDATGVYVAGWIGGDAFVMKIVTIIVE
jgi:hypothetical protein